MSLPKKSLSNLLRGLLFFLFLIIFSLNFALSLGNIKSYLEGEAQNHAQDTATSLGMSLSPYMTDTSDPVIETIINAFFDMGYYKEIRLVAAGGKELVTRSYDENVEGVPGWFIAWFPMSPAIAEREISSGWTITGVVYVTVNTSFAYSSLYQQAKRSLVYSVATLIVSMVLLELILWFALKDLKLIAQMALKIADRDFVTIDKEPGTTEIKDVAAAMNFMSQRIKERMDHLERDLDETRAKLSCDDLTGLDKKSVFDTDMKPLLRRLMDHGAAYLMLIKVDSLAVLVKDHGRESINQLLQAFAQKLQEAARLYPDFNIKNYRFYGGEFAMLVISDHAEQIEPVAKQIESIAKTLSSDFAALGQQYGKTDLAHIGVARVNPVGTAESTLDAAQEAYEAASNIRDNGYSIRTDYNFARDISAWKDLVFRTIDNASYSLSYVGKITSLHTGQAIMEEAFTQVHDSDGELVAIAPFVSIAEKFGKIMDLDKGVILTVLDHIQNNQIQHAIAVNLSTRTIKNAEFCLWLEKLLNNNQIAATQLIFSFSAYAVAKDVNAHADFIQTLHQWGGRVMIKRFETQSLSPDVIKTLKPDFVRLARELGDCISRSREKYEFVQAMQHMGRLLEFAVLAENVQADDDYQVLMSIGIEGASR